MNDGIYDIEVTLEGGSGKATVTSPMKITVSGGSMTAEVEWSSSNYDLMIVDGEEFLPVNESGNSVFVIPVSSLDEPLSVQAETLAMSQPHLIDYTIIFNGTVGTTETPGTTETTETTAAPADTAFPVVPVAVGGAAVVCVIAVIAAAVITKRKKK